MRSRGADSSSSSSEHSMLVSDGWADQNENRTSETNTHGHSCENPAFDVARDAESSRKSSTAWSVISGRTGGEREQFRTLQRRSSVENFGQFGFLVPALALVPQADGADALTKQFGDLQGDRRELKLAAAHIEDALKGRGNYGKARSYFKPKLARRCFNILDNPWFRRVIYCNILLHSFLIVLEPPTVPVQEVSPLVLVLGLLCILLYVFDLVVHIIFLTWPVFWSRKAEAGVWNGVQFVLVSLFLFDYILLVASRLSGEYIPQIFRCFRLLVVLYKLKNIRHIFNVLITIGFKLSKVFFIIFVFILMCASIGVHIFMDIYECNDDVKNPNSTSTHDGKTVPCAVNEEERVYKGAFNNIAGGMLRLFVLLSTENYPEVMLPALRTNAAYFIFFGLFVFAGVFFLTAILLAIVVDSYWVYSKKHVKKERSRERAELAKAWNLLDPLGHGALDLYDEKFTELFRILKPKCSDEENAMLIEMLDTNEDGEVDSFEWTTMLSQVLSLEFEKEGILEDSACRSKCAYGLKEIARFITESVTFARLILFLIIVHCILFTLKWKGQSLETLFFVQVLRSIIVLIFLFEVAMRMLVYGKMMLEPFELMDLILVVVAFLTNFLWYINYPAFFVFRNYATAVSGLAVFFRLPFNNAQLKRAIEIFVRIAPVMADLMCLLGIILYFMATVGMELFHNTASTGRHMYLPSCGLGFDNFWCSCLILFQMVTTSNWHEIMNSVMDATGIPWASLYFVVAYIVVTMVVMNLFVAIAIEAFNKLAASEEEPTLDRKPSGLRPATAQPDTVKNQAVQMLNNFASSLFGSSRADQVEERRQSLAVVTSKRRPSIRRGSVVKTMGPTSEDVEKAEDEEQDDFEKDDGKGDKRERLLKKRMKDKKRARRKLSMAEHKVRVVTAFRGARENELELTVGDEVTVIKKKDDWWQGRCQKRIGWFPASHVILRTVKAIPEYGRPSPPQDDVSGRQRLGGVDTDPRGDQVLPLVKEKSSVSPKENSFFREPTWANPPPGTPPSVRGRVKLKKTGDWRREILGDMTVMNAEEMRELNNIMRAELRTPTGLRSKKLSVIGRPGEDDAMRDSVFMEEQDFVDIGQVARPGSSRSMETRPYSARFLGPGSPRFTRNAVGPSGRLRTESSSSTDSQRSRGIPPIPSVEFFETRTPTPPHISEANAKKTKCADRLVVANESSHKPKGKSKSGEMPEWMLKFVQDKNLVVGEDVKLDDHSGRRRSSTTMVTSTNTGGSGSPRSRDSGTGTRAKNKTGSSPKLGKTVTKETKNKSAGSSPGELVEKPTKKGASPNSRKKSGPAGASKNPGMHITPRVVAQQPL